MIDPDFDPLKDLNELKHHAVLIETHIINLIKNERVLIDQINKMQDQLDYIERKLNAITSKE
jgi:hypothetical protein